MCVCVCVLRYTFHCLGATLQVWLIWRSANGVGHINKVKLRRARLVLGLVTTSGRVSTIPEFSRPLSDSGPQILAIRPWVGTTSTGNGFGHCWWRNGDFCVALGPVTRTAGVLSYCILAQLGLTLTRSKVKGGWTPSRRTSRYIRKFYSVSSVLQPVPRWLAQTPAWKWRCL